MSIENKQKFWWSFLWPLVMLGVLILLGVRNHSNTIGWIVCGAGYLAGLGYLIYQYAQDEETIFPDVVMAISAFAILAFL